jgi:hypothetical protein
MPKRLVRTRPDLESIRSEVSEWYALKRQATVVNAELEKRRKKLQESLGRYGETDPSDGSVYLDLGDPMGDQNIQWLKNLCVSTKVMDEEVAEEILSAKGLWEEVTDLVRVPDESRITAAYYDRKINDDELARMFPQTIGYRFYLLDYERKQVRA